MTMRIGWSWFTFAALLFMGWVLYLLVLAMAHRLRKWATPAFSERDTSQASPLIHLTAFQKNVIHNMNMRSMLNGASIGIALLMLGTIAIPAQQAANLKGAVNQAQKAAHRVPPLFSQVGLTSEQREQIYAVRERYLDKINALRKQIDDLQATEVTECETVLTPAQRKLLNSLRDGANAKGAGTTVEDPDAPAKKRAAKDQR